jgi:hypothetical protein
MRNSSEIVFLITTQAEGFSEKKDIYIFFKMGFTIFIQISELMP